ncbi:MAG: hypothetical protein HN712_19265 [Gemmatimonadetes bacterium]|jgi:hypothetical protein|nr:hypothetical protein [Gemmatimonadota bacterium]MBT7862464.1 hypothetical protein [Gemmatimonadota bacterium]
MNLKTKPDLEEVKRRWDAFWAGEVIHRPMVCAAAPKDGTRALVDTLSTRYWNPCSGNYKAQLDLLDEWADKTLFMGDLIPHVSPDHGPDQFAAWLGSELKFSPHSIGTNWVEPSLTDWESFLPVTLQKDNAVWQSVLEYASLLKDRGKGKYIVGMPDLHSHMDALSALRHPGQLCLDLYDIPERVRGGCAQVRALYPEIYESIRTAGGMSEETGTIGWFPMWCDGKTAAVQCDFSVFLGNDMWREFVLPGIEEEVSYLDRCFYHLDGLQQLNHLDDLLALPRLDGVQFVPGTGQPEMFWRHWRDVLKKILAAGKKVIVYGNMDLEAVKDVHRDLGAEGVIYEIFGATRDEIDAILMWLRRNT